MGNTQSIKTIKLSTIINDLTKLDSSVVRTRVVQQNDHDETPYKVVIPVGEYDDDIITNICVPDSEFKNVVLAIGTQIFCGNLLDDKQWHFDIAIPLFKIPTEQCTLSIYTLNDVEGVAPINLNYDSYSAPETVKLNCIGNPITSGTLVYDGGCVY